MSASSQPVAPGPSASPATGSPAEESSEDEPNDSTPAEPDETRVLTGDLVTLKSGKVLSGGQVIRSTPKAYVIQMGPDIEPMEIPRRMVESITYDDIDPLKQARERALEASRPADTEMLAGERLSPELSEKLNTDIGDEPTRYDKRDYVNILDELATTIGVKIEIHDSVRQLKGDERLWTAEIPANTTLISLIQVYLRESFGNLTIQFLSDGILIITKDAAQAQVAPAEPVPPQ